MTGFAKPMTPPVCIRRASPVVVCGFADRTLTVMSGCCLQVLSMASPRAILNAITPSRITAPASAAERTRVASLRQDIVALDSRGGAQQAPDLPEGAPWVNSGPMRLAQELRGRAVVLDFWTYCCGNCQSVLPALAALEQRFEGQPFVLVGVHSGKFEHERDPAAVRAAVER
jgi:thiol-disulfide isomerase/thioredoxin